MENNSYHISNPAFLGLIDNETALKIAHYFESGKTKLYIGSDANIGYRSGDFQIAKVYFKIKGDDFISYEADFIEITDQNFLEFRLHGAESDEAKSYYGFANFKKMDEIIPLDRVENYHTSKLVRKTQPCPAIVNILQ